MGDTTITLDEETKQHLSDYRAPGHDSWDDLFWMFMDLFPDIDTFRDGCGNCDWTPYHPDDPERNSFVVEHFHTTFDGSDTTGRTLYCSRECMAEVQQEIDHQLPSDPQQVRVGGYQQDTITFADASFEMDGEVMWVEIPVPGAFSEAWEGEPIYLQNELGDWVQGHVIDAVRHYENGTVIDFGHDAAVTQLYHPDTEKARSYCEGFAPWVDFPCPDCGTDLSVCMGQLPGACPECDIEFDTRESVIGHLSEEQRERLETLEERAISLREADDVAS